MKPKENKLMEYNATITKIVEMNHKIREFTVKLDAGDPTFEAGQFALIGLKDDEGNMIRRAYSIVSAPGDGDRHFYIILKYTPDVFDATKTPKALTPILFNAKEGDRIFMAPRAVGHFTPKLAKGAKQILYVATGTGLAPFRGMLRAHEDLLKTTKIALLHGVRHEDDFGYTDELQALAQKYPKNFFFFPIASSPSQDYTGSKGRVTTIMKDGDIQAAFGEDFGLGTHAYFCGSPAMIKDGTAILEDLGVPTDNLHKEVQ
ncbi:MAG: ferredoxin--NADP reductase [Alphaproteobacteria bacterium]|nr:ferredoxin--NADP reductase [Alphaproteobacteria bacterium]MBN2779547.1 ferredoxin--NADP reductase [Alphaproteobacteria bacterium]